MYGEWLLGVAVKAQQIYKPRVILKGGISSWVVVTKRKNGGKRFYGQDSKKNLVKTGEIDVKKHEESEKISFKELQPQEMGEK